jgi:hypothetical protein
MFTIELLRGENQEHASVVETATSPRYFVYDVEHRAKTLLTDARRKFPDDPPNGYRILDKDGKVVASFWREIARPLRGTS